MGNPWAFGWTQLLTLIGFAITIGIAVGGFRTFGRWRREKLEERRIEAALDALTIAHETKFIFQNIRSPLTEGYEWADMPQWDGDTDEKRQRRGPFFASIKRINANKEFFERVWRAQPRCMALFGPKVEETFLKLHQATAPGDAGVGSRSRTRRAWPCCGYRMERGKPTNDHKLIAVPPQRCAATQSAGCGVFRG